MRLFFCDFQIPCISVLNHKNVDDIGIFLSVSQISCKTIFRPCHQPLTLCTRVVLSTTIFHNHFWSPAVVAIERKQAEVTKIIFLDDSRGKRDVVKHRRSAQCLKITKNIAFSKTRQNWPFLVFLTTQNGNVARFARNVEWDFLGNFQTLWFRVTLVFYG